MGGVPCLSSTLYRPRDEGEHTLRAYALLLYSGGG